MAVLLGRLTGNWRPEQREGVGHVWGHGALSWGKALEAESSKCKGLEVGVIGAFKDQQGCQRGVE